MGEYFHSWRRRVGVFTLAMACLLAGAWVRSCLILEYLEIPGRGENNYLLASLNSSLGWQIVPQAKRNVIPYRWHSQDIEQRDADENQSDIQWHWRFAGFKAGEVSGEKFWLIPYWSMTIPLTLLSAFLLLSNPRPAKTAAKNHSDSSSQS